MAYIFSEEFWELLWQKKDSDMDKENWVFFPSQLKREKENRYFIARDLSHRVTETTPRVVWLIR